MMTSQQILNFVTAEPFRPFRISMASGRSFDIRHPEMVKVGRTTATVYTLMSDNPEEARERQQEVSIILIESLKPIDSRAPTGHSAAS